MRLQQIFAGMKARAVAAPAPHNFIVVLPDDDDDGDDDAPPAVGDALSGFACIIDYLNAKGEASSRRVSFIRYERAKGVDYLRAHCHERRAMRVFRLDRISEIYDIETGEALGVASVFGQVRPDHEQASSLAWGLSPPARADLIAGLNVLTFLARCDKEWHPLEEEWIEHFTSIWWMRREVLADLPMSDILARARKLRPDAEAFFGALLRAADCSILRRLLPDHIDAIILADGKITSEECYWANKAKDYLATA